MVPLIVAGGVAAGAALGSMYSSSKQANLIRDARRQNMELLGNYNGKLAPRIQGMEGDYAAAMNAAGQSRSLDQNPFFASVDSFNPGVFQGAGNLADDPGYQARMQANERALNTRDAVAGSLRSGQGAQEYAREMQDYASQEYQNAYNRALNTYQTQLGAQNQMFGQANQLYQNQWGQEAANMQQQLALAGLNAQMLGQQYGLEGQALSAAMGQNSGAAQGMANAYGGASQGMMNLGGDIFQGVAGYYGSKAAAG